MNVYKINEYHIAAKNLDSAFNHYLDVKEPCPSDYFGEFAEGEEDEFVIKIKRLTNEEMNSEFITCCWDGCSVCEDKDEPILYSPNQMLEREKDFPCVICREE